MMPSVFELKCIPFWICTYEGCVKTGLQFSVQGNQLLWFQNIPLPQWAREPTWGPNFCRQEVGIRQHY